MNINRCLVCNVDMGPANGRQLCYKTYCPNAYQLSETESSETESSETESSETESSETKVEDSIDAKSEESYETNSSETNRCIICNVDMGPENPRQLCRKTWCPKEFDENDSSDVPPKKVKIN